MEDKPDKKDLEKKEQELAKREESVKEGRRKELEEQERLIAHKHLEKLVDEERERIENGESPGDDEKVGEEEYWEQRKKTEKIPELLQKEKNRIEGNMKQLQDEYHQGSISEEDFRKMMDTYQRELVEVNVGLRKESQKEGDLEI